MRFASLTARTLMRAEDDGRTRCAGATAARTATRSIATAPRAWPPTPGHLRRSRERCSSVDGVLHLVAGVAGLVSDVAHDVLETALGAVCAALRLEALVVRQRASGFLDAALGFVALATHVRSFHETWSSMGVPVFEPPNTRAPQWRISRTDAGGLPKT